MEGEGAAWHPEAHKSSCKGGPATAPLLQVPWLPGSRRHRLRADMQGCGRTASVLRGLPVVDSSSAAAAAAMVATLRRMPSNATAAGGAIAHAHACSNTLAPYHSHRSKGESFAFCPNPLYCMLRAKLPRMQGSAWHEVGRTCTASLSECKCKACSLSEA